VLVVGGTGMLGSICVQQLRDDPLLQVDSTGRDTSGEWQIDVYQDPSRLWSLLRRRRYDLVINGIGVLRAAMSGGAVSAREASYVNATFPHELAGCAAELGSRVVHVSTDAVFSGRIGAPYDEGARPNPEDRYGASKWAGEPDSPAALTIRCSIVGRHHARPAGLIDWILGRPSGSHVQGFTDYRWTPATTFQVARFVARLADRTSFDRLRSLSPVVHFAPNPPLTKWAMIDMLRTIARPDVRVEKADSPSGPVDLSLTTRFEVCREMSADARSWPDILSEVLL
jgi:dTDP-4-dehydrorhamnose reductase